MKKVRIFLRSLSLVSLVFILGVLCLMIYVQLSVNPTIWFVRWAFDQTSYTPHEDLEIYKADVLMLKDEIYTSVGENNTFDVFVRKDLKDEVGLPTILWVHGGAFVAGSKQDVADYMYVLAYEGYTVVSMNYGLGFENQYPMPLHQINELYDHIKQNQNDYPFVDLKKLVIGGDSAGAFIAAQYTLIQTNPVYADLVEIEAKIPKADIQSIILFCGPYDFNLLKNLLGESNVRSVTGILADMVVPYIASKIGEAYLGDPNWATNPDFEVLSLTNYVTKDFPKVFITDANTFSFEPHARLLEEKLLEVDVDVTSIYYEAVLLHEYQFSLSTIHKDGRNYGLETLDSVLSFLEATFE